MKIIVSTSKYDATSKQFIQESFSLDVNANESIGEVKKKIHQIKEILPECIILRGGKIRNIVKDEDPIDKVYSCITNQLSKLRLEKKKKESEQGPSNKEVLEKDEQYEEDEYDLCYYVADFTILEDEKRLADYNIFDGDVLTLNKQPEFIKEKGTIVVHSRQSGNCEVEIAGSDTVGILKQKIFALKNIKPAMQLLQRGDKTLEDDNEVLGLGGSLALRQGDNIRLIQKPARTSYQIFIKTMTGKTITFDIDPWAKLIELQKKLYNKEGIPLESQRLIFAGTQLEGHRTAIEYEIMPESTLHLVLCLRGGMLHVSSGRDGGFNTLDSGPLARLRSTINKYNNSSTVSNKKTRFAADGKAKKPLRVDLTVLKPDGTEVTLNISRNTTTSVLKRQLLRNDMHEDEEEEDEDDNESDNEEEDSDGDADDGYESDNDTKEGEDHSRLMQRLTKLKNRLAAQTKQ